MKINPNNIKSQTFSTSFRGFDKTEVKTFLNNLSDDLTDILLENENLKKELEYHKAKNSEYVKIEKNLQEVLLKTQDEAEKRLEDAQKEANNIIAKAKKEAEELINETKNKIKQLEEEIDLLENRKMLLIIKLKNFLSLQADLLKVDLSKNDKTQDKNSELNNENAPTDNTPKSTQENKS
ncbi:MAG TPA: DivIVA domain-containing protein [Ignavibacteriales bacterium]|mgnify:CR=1 FL=1|nr:DivIVA domain-containing protein [Bacteroidales bacterium]HOJ36651.1 DivIVA domain-containing protein [Ignavibacteriales bacterium]HOL81865.1 DivIVA domain-containing protein [Ignavibacteriales bacterium]HOM65034.1 DivIVA domain-containing protein [Ignavibacteriales bacterium]HPD67234.1 DivIVA domain-containing protein [Ignavibacteriales bacterium]